MKKNFGIKILVIIIAMFLWVQQVLLKTHIQEIPVLILLNDIPDNLVLTEETPIKVPVIIEARGMDLFILKLSNISFKVNAENFKYGKNVFKVTEQDLSYPERLDLNLKKIKTDKGLSVLLDKLITKKKPIKILYASAKDEEFFLQYKILNPQQQVEIKGPSSIIKNIKRIKTRKISQRMVKDYKLTVSLVNPNENTNLLTNQVVFEIMNIRIITRTISLIPIKYPENLNISIIPQKVSAMISGPEDIVSKLDNKIIIAYLNEFKIKKNNFVQVDFDLPAGVKLIEYTPHKIQIIHNE